MKTDRSGPRHGGTTAAARRSGGPGGDIGPVALGVVLVVASAVVGRMLLAGGADLLLPFPPLLAQWLPHVGPGTPVAAVVAVAVVAYGPVLTASLSWRRLLLTAWLAAVAWTLALALVDGWQRGVVERLSSGEEYLHDVPRVGGVREMLATFADHVLTDQPVHWTTHVGAHPPGVFLFYVVLDRVGLGGGGAPGVVTVVVGASACAAVAVTLRALGAEEVARRALPFGVLLPGAVWVGVSADGMFAAVLAWGVALLAVGATGRGAGADAAALGGGVLLGGTLYLSYGLVLGLLLLPVAVLATTRRWRAAVFAAVGAAVVVGAFTASGFWWLTGFERVRVIYAASIAASRPYSYFVWANLAALSIAVGPAVYAGIRRALATPRPFPTAAAALVLAALAAIVVADLTGLSKAEVERIWLPFAVWLVVPCALLPRPRAWLAAQAVLALAVNHLLLTVW
jgi:methylthioxylose transferase